MDKRLLQTMEMIASLSMSILYTWIKCCFVTWIAYVLAVCLLLLIYGLCILYETKCDDNKISACFDRWTCFIELICTHLVLGDHVAGYVPWDTAGIVAFLCSINWSPVDSVNARSPWFSTYIFFCQTLILCLEGSSPCEDTILKPRGSGRHKWHRSYVW